jgi:hypothetical protein
LIQKVRLFLTKNNHRLSTVAVDISEAFASQIEAILYNPAVDLALF